jgi:hypothetical protein
MKKLVIIAGCCTLAAIATVGAVFGVKQLSASSSQATEKETIVEVDQSTGIDFPWNYGWGRGTNIVPGVPIHFDYENKDYSMEVTADDAMIYFQKDGTSLTKDYTIDVPQPVQVASGNIIYWVMFNMDIWALPSDVHYVNIIIKEKDTIVGYAIVKIASRISDLGGKGYIASIVKNVLFQVDNNGQSPTVSEDYVWEQINAIEQN